jgi:hypothetical protein
MDKDEEAGLRAFAITVRADAQDGRPVSLAREHADISVAAIDAEWGEEERLGYRVRLSDGSCWLLYYVPELELWSGIPDAGHAGSEQR